MHLPSAFAIKQFLINMCVCIFTQEYHLLGLGSWSCSSVSLMDHSLPRTHLWSSGTPASTTAQSRGLASQETSTSLTTLHRYMQLHCHQCVKCVQDYQSFTPQPVSSQWLEYNYCIDVTCTCLTFFTFPPCYCPPCCLQATTQLTSPLASPTQSPTPSPSGSISSVCPGLGHLPLISQFPRPGGPAQGTK